MLILMLLGIVRFLHEFMYLGASSFNRMFDMSLFFAVIAGICLLLVLILRFKFPAFIALFLGSITVGVFAGLSAEEIISTLQQGMGGTLGFVAIVVGLGTILGGLLEHSGGAEALAQYLLQLFGKKNASWALMCTGFIIAIPVFFDVAFILLIPLVYSLQRKTGKSLLFYGLPLLAGLAITHAFIPPTPGPVAVAEILSANLGWVIVLGFVVGIPTAIFSGPIFSNYIASKIHVEAPQPETQNSKTSFSLKIHQVFFVIALPLMLIVFKTLSEALEWNAIFSPTLVYILSIIGHPFGALIVANIAAWYVLGIKKGVSSKELNQIANRSMAPAGLIILLTGAGGTFKQMLITTNAGKTLAESLSAQGVPLLFFAFLTAVAVRLLQGSATVAMITAAGMTASLVTDLFSSPQRALLVLAIASGSSIFSHVNDSGFWLVSNYLGLSEKETFRSWSIMTLLIALVGFCFVCLLWFLF